VRGRYGVVGGGFTDVVLRSSINYRHEHATQSRRPHKDVAAARGAVILRFHGFSNLGKVLNSGSRTPIVCDRL